MTLLQRSGGPLPQERAYHAACCLGYGSEHPCILVTGGWANNGETLKDAWIYDFTSNCWVEVIINTVYCSYHIVGNFGKHYFNLVNWSPKHIGEFLIWQCTS